MQVHHFDGIDTPSKAYFSIDNGQISCHCGDTDIKGDLHGLSWEEGQLGTAGTAVA